jgi:hypothetical protein
LEDEDQEFKEALDRLHPGWDDPAYLLQVRKDRELRAGWGLGSDGPQRNISLKLLDAVRDDLRLIFKDPAAISQAEQIPAIARLARYSKEDGLEALGDDLLEIAETAPGELNRPIKLLLSIEGDPDAKHSDRLVAAAGSNGSARKWCEMAVLTELAWRLVEIAEPTALYRRYDRSGKSHFFIERYGFELRFRLDDDGVEVPYLAVARLAVQPREYDRFFSFDLPIKDELVTRIKRVSGAGGATWLGPYCVLYLGTGIIRERPQRYKFEVEFEIDPKSKIDDFSFSAENYETGRVEFAVVYARNDVSRLIMRRKTPHEWRRHLLEPEREILDPGNYERAEMTFIPFGDNSYYFRFDVDKDTFSEGQASLF